MRLGDVAGMGARPVGEPEADIDRDHGHGRAVAVPVGHERDPVEVGTAGEVGGPGQVTVGDDHPIEAGDGQRGDAGGDRPVEAGPVDPDHGRSEPLRPVGDLVVVAHHRHGKWRCCGDHRLGHPAGEVGPLARIEDR